MGHVLEQRISASVVASAASGDELAFARLIAAYDDDLARVAYLITADVQLAHDATQAAWAQAWQKLPGLRNRDGLRAWLVAIAVNEARQLLRSRRRRAVREIPIGDPGELTALAGHDSGPRADDIDLWRALDALDVEDRSIVAMRYVLGLSSFEIARATGRSAPGVRSRLARALARLRKDLGDE